MISKRTVFVLGAGASHSYGWPLAEDLLEAADALQRNQDSSRQAVIDAIGCHADELDDFIDRLRKSKLYSIDRFLEKRPDDSRHQAIGKTIIAHGLAVGRQRFGGESDDWVRRVWDAMQSFAKTPNQAIDPTVVRFVTFNFDTSLEMQLSSAAIAAFPFFSKDSIRQRVANSIVHVHGALPPPPKAYELPPRQNVLWLKQAAEAIHVVHEETLDTSRTAKAWIDQAEMVVFLGFAFDPVNVQKLGYFPELDPKRAMAEVYASAFGLYAGDLARAQRLFYRSVVFGDSGDMCEVFLRRHDVLWTA